MLFIILSNIKRKEVFNIAIRIKKKYQGRQREQFNDVINERIRANNLLVISPNEEKPKKMSRDEALKKARSLELDLVLITENAELPVARIIDYGKFKYERKKKEQQRKKNQKIVEVKEVRLTQRIGEHDLQVKLKDARRFLEKGNKVKVSLRFRRNEMGDQSKALALLQRVREELDDVISKATEPKGRAIFLDMMLDPKQTKK